MRNVDSLFLHSPFVLLVLHVHVRSFVCSFVRSLVSHPSNRRKTSEHKTRTTARTNNHTTNQPTVAETSHHPSLCFNNHHLLILSDHPLTSQDCTRLHCTALAAFNTVSHLHHSTQHNTTQHNRPDQSSVLIDEMPTAASLRRSPQRRCTSITKETSLMFRKHYLNRSNENRPQMASRMNDALIRFSTGVVETFKDVTTQSSSVLFFRSWNGQESGKKP